MSARIGVTAFALAMLACAPAIAQTAPAAQGGSSTGEGESLSGKLSKTDGVITPKANVDPDIKVPAPVPHPNSTPVIPPAATGGNSAK